MRRSILLLPSLALLISPLALASDFMRGDANGDGIVDIADVSALFEGLFSSGDLPCEDAGDANDDGYLDISDPTYILSYLFWDGAAPPHPFPRAGADPTDDRLTCKAGTCAETVSVEDHYTTGSDPSDARLGDVDGDGDLDLVVTSLLSNEFTVRFNAGDGTFDESAVYDSLYHPWRVALIDADGDRDLDLVIRNLSTCLETAEVRIRRYGACQTTVMGQPTLYVGWCTTLRTRCIDTAPANFTLHTNAGDGSFVDPQRVPASLFLSQSNGLGLDDDSISAVSLGLTGDLDGNGEEDSITLDADNDSLTVIRNGVCPAEDEN